MTYFSTRKDFDGTAFGSANWADAKASPNSPNEGGTSVQAGSAGILSEAASPRLVIRGENPYPDPQDISSKSKAAIVDWLNFTFVMSKDDRAFRNLDICLRNAFGFGFGPCRHRGHLNYEESWELGEKYGIFASGGSSVAGTSMISIQGSGCAATKNWRAVHDLVVELNAKITRIDLAHDDYEGIHNINTALQLYREGAFFNLHGRPPKPQLIDDFDSGDGKTFYLGKRKNGKILRVYEKGKQLGKPDSPWVRWELELHCDAYEIPAVVILHPGLYLAGSYPCLKWISAETRHFEAVKQSQSIAFEKLLKACKNSYGKLLWTMSEVLEWSNDEIVDELKKEGIPNRMKMPVVGTPDQP